GRFLRRLGHDFGGRLRHDWCRRLGRGLDRRLRLRDQRSAERDDGNGCEEDTHVRPPSSRERPVSERFFYSWLFPFPSLLKARPCLAVRMSWPRTWRQSWRWVAETWRPWPSPRGR